ncbi:MAG: Hpt domain-containing protein [Lachnospiraceae bacterium]|nr:Hpt domain-containing protein [Lachnospiraceae bacterium]
MTIEKLEQWGADTKNGLARCLNNEDFYLKMVDMALNGDGFEKLGTALEKKDLKAAFEAAHALKGVMANLALTPLQDLVSQMTELLRAGTDMDYTPLYEEVMARYSELKSLRD